MTRPAAWTFRNPVHVVFGAGRLVELSDHVRGRSVIVTTAGMTRRGVTGRVVDLLGADRCAVFDDVTPNPTPGMIADAVRSLGTERVETIVAVGGGSAIDVGKVLSLALHDRAFDLEAVLAGDRSADGIDPLRVVAIPTTAGTGSEVTPFAALWDPKLRRKLSLTTPVLHPTAAILDPELTVSLPWEATIGPGLDAYTQCFEAIWNLNAMPVTTALAQRGLERIPGALRLLRSTPDALDARSDMLEAALLSGLAISQTRTALAHSMSYPITAHLGLPHGLACALLLPAVLSYNLEADDGRLADVARRLGLDSTARLVSDVTRLLRDLGVDGLIRAHVPDIAALDELAPEMLTPGRADNNMRAADASGVREILAATAAWFEASRATS